MVGIPETTRSRLCDGKMVDAIIGIGVGKNLGIGASEFIGFGGTTVFRVGGEEGKTIDGANVGNDVEGGSVISGVFSSDIVGLVVKTGRSLGATVGNNVGPADGPSVGKIVGPGGIVVG